MGGDTDTQSEHGAHTVLDLGEKASTAGSEIRRSFPVGRLAVGTAAAGLAVAAYMAFEAQWVRCREVDLPIPGLPAPWSGLSVLHLSDVHAGTFTSNDRSLDKVVRWARRLAPDLVLLTGDILGDPKRSQTCLRLLDRLEPPLGMFAVTGNHEYGLSKGPLARPRETTELWRRAGINLLSDSCVVLPPRDETAIVLCGADYISGGCGLLCSHLPLSTRTGNAASSTQAAAPDAASLAAAVSTLTETFPILLIHEPPPRDSPLAHSFPLAFAGHTHGGQLRLPCRSGLTPIHRLGGEYAAGVNAWNGGTLVVSQGIGTSFLPFRLLTRPEATMWRLVYTSLGNATAADQKT